MNKSYCPYAWNHFSTQTDGRMRLCCNVEYGSFIKDNQGQDVTIDKIDNLLDYYNLDHFKRIRKNMINNVENPECHLCYNIEKNGGHSIRQYAIKNYPYENFESITDKETGAINEPVVNYLDLSWSNKCNLQCRMCTPNASDQLIKEYKDLNLDSNPNDIEIRLDFKPRWAYDKISQVLEKITNNKLNQILVTGGEPLINNDFYKFCETLIAKDLAKNISISFHTNLTVMPQKWIEILGQFQKVVFKISIDGIKNCYEYIRYPGKWSILESNIIELSDIIKSGQRNFEIEFHTVLSIFNAHGLIDLLDFLVSLPEDDNIRKMPHLNYIFHPDHGSPTHLPSNIKTDIIKSVQHWIQKNSEEYKLSKEKITLVLAVLQMMQDNQTTIPVQKEIIQKIKMVDQYRSQNTYENLPWLDIFEKSLVDKTAF